MGKSISYLTALTLLLLSLNSFCYADGTIIGEKSIYDTDDITGG
jgi:hypothetical protein